MASAMPDSGARVSRKKQHTSNNNNNTDDEENLNNEDTSTTTTPLPSLFHKGQLVIRNEGSVTRDYLGKFHF